MRRITMALRHADWFEVKKVKHKPRAPELPKGEFHEVGSIRFRDCEFELLKKAPEKKQARVFGVGALYATPGYREMSLYNV